jgi:hypothetical protein
MSVHGVVDPYQAIFIGARCELIPPDSAAQHVITYSCPEGYLQRRLTPDELAARVAKTATISAILDEAAARRALRIRDRQMRRQIRTLTDPDIKLEIHEFLLEMHATRVHTMSLKRLRA